MGCRQLQFLLFYIKSVDLMFKKKWFSIFATKEGKLQQQIVQPKGELEFSGNLPTRELSHSPRARAKIVPITTQCEGQSAIGYILLTLCQKQKK